MGYDEGVIEKEAQGRRGWLSLSAGTEIQFLVASESLIYTIIIIHIISSKRVNTVLISPWRSRRGLSGRGEGAKRHDVDNAQRARALGSLASS